jgi:hypothetical protein
MRSKDQILLENLYSKQILKENIDGGDRHGYFPDNQGNEPIDGVDPEEMKFHWFSDEANERISNLKTAQFTSSLDYNVENEKIIILFPSVEFLSDVNINIDMSLESQIDDIKSTISNFINEKNINGLMFDVNASADEQAEPDKIERIGTGNEWIGVSLELPEMDIDAEEQFDRYFKLLSIINNFLLSLTDKFKQ